MPGQNLIAITLLLFVFGAAIVKLLTPAAAPAPAPEPAEQRTCEARPFGPVCGLIATHDDTHVDGTPMATCPGCHDRGVALGHLRPEGAAA